MLTKKIADSNKEFLPKQENLFEKSVTQLEYNYYFDLNTATLSNCATILIILGFMGIDVVWI